MSQPFQQLLKRKYSTQEKVDNIGLVKTTFTKDVPKKVDPEGESYTSFLTVSGGQGWSGTRTGARAISGQGNGRGNGDWIQITNKHGSIKGEVRWDELDIKRANSGSASAMRAVLAHTDGHLAGFGQFAEGYALNHRGGYLCTGTVDGSGVVTITSNAEHITRVRKYQIVVASAANGTSGSLLGAPSLGYVIATSRTGATTTFTVSTTSGGSAGTPASWTGTMYFFIYETWYGSNGGACTDGGTDSAFLIDSVDSWCPSTAPGATPFKGIVRNTDDLLGGLRLTSTEVAGKNTLERLQLLAVTGEARFNWEKRKRKVYLHPTRFLEASILLQSTDVRERGFKGESTAGVGYDGIVVKCTGAEFELISTPLMDPDTAYMLVPEDWLLHSHAGWPGVIDDDGLRFVRIDGEDAFALQYTAYGSLRTERPNEVARCPLN
jgi:hypothetical protein